LNWQGYKHLSPARGLSPERFPLTLQEALGSYAIISFGETNAGAAEAELQ
jgi:hypothetical protein